MSQEKKSTVGDPIWVESLLTAEELRECRRLYPSTVKSSKHVEYDPNYHTGGTWRKGMGATLTTEEIKRTNDAMDKLHELLRTKHFQKLKAQYGNPKLQ